MNTSAQSSGVPAQGGKGGVQQPQVQQPAQVPAQGGKTPNANGTYTGQLSPQMAPYIDAMRPQQPGTGNPQGLSFQASPQPMPSPQELANRQQQYRQQALQSIVGYNSFNPGPQPAQVAGPPPLPLSAYIPRQKSPVEQQNFERSREAMRGRPPTATEMRLQAMLDRGGAAALQERLQNATTQELQALGLPRPQVLPAQPQQQGLMGLQNSGFSRFKNRYR
jgi:hypothetical protein